MVNKSKCDEAEFLKVKGPAVGSGRLCGIEVRVDNGPFIKISTVRFGFA